MARQIFQNSDSTCGAGIQFPLIDYRKFGQISEELQRDYARNAIGPNKYAIGKVDVTIGDRGNTLCFECRDEDEGTLKRVLGLFDLPRDTESRHIVAFAEEESPQSET